MVAKWPLRCTAMTASNSSSLVLANIRSRTMPALFTNTSSPPNVSIAVWISPSACCQSATLTPLVTASPPAAVISSTTAWAALPPPAGEPSSPTPMSLTTTRAPSAANASACARPMPPPEPVTMTTRPSSKPILFVSLFVLVRAGCFQVRRRFPATVHRERGTADVRRRIGRQECCRPADFRRFSQPAERDGGPDRCDRLGVAVEQFRLFGLHHAHDDGVDPHFGCPFDRQRRRQAVHTCFRRAVRR